MTSRDELEELLERLEDHAKLHDDIVPMDEEQAQWANDLRNAAAAIRELLAQEPVGTIGEENFTQHVMVGVNGWHTLPSPASAPIMFKVLPAGTPLYAAPVPAVDPSWQPVPPRACVKPTHEAADAFWKYWKENGETHKHGYYESTWGAINAALAVGWTAVDLEVFKAEAMRLADEYALRTAEDFRDDSYKAGGFQDQARAALQAHLDKLGGK